MDRNHGHRDDVEQESAMGLSEGSQRATARIEFATDGVWAASELADFLTAIQVLHDALLPGAIVFPEPWGLSSLGAYIGRSASILSGEPATTYPQRESMEHGLMVEPLQTLRTSVAAGPLYQQATEGQANALQAVVDELAALIPHSIRVLAIRMGSPGLVSLEGIGEIPRGIAEAWERFYQRKARREQVQVAADRDAIALEREELELAREKFSFARELFITFYPNEQLSTPTGQQLFARILKGRFGYSRWRTPGR